jgi:TRAP-type C4-dicarboxylate transport system permease small subunit
MVDDTIYALEQMIVSCALATMAILVFVDVVYRRLVSPDSAFDFILLHFTEEGTTTYAWGGPLLAGALAFLLFWFAFATAERQQQRALINVGGSALILAGLSTLAGAALCYLMVVDGVTAQHFYLGLYGLGSVSFLRKLSRSDRPDKPQRLVAFGALTTLVVWFALNHMPEDYSWSKEFSLVLLLWVGFLGASICAYAGRHLRMEALNKLVPEHFRTHVTALGFGATAAFSFFLAWLGYKYIFNEPTGAWYLDMPYEQTALPGWSGVIVVPIAFGLAGLRFIAAGVSTLQGGSYGKAGPGEGMTELEESQHSPTNDADPSSEPTAPTGGDRPESASEPAGASTTGSESDSNPDETDEVSS